MEFTLQNNIMVDLGNEYCDLLAEGYTNEQAYDIMQEQVRNEHDGDIWELVDSEENTDQFEFEDVLNEIMEEVESKGNYYYENSLAG